MLRKFLKSVAYKLPLILILYYLIRDLLIQNKGVLTTPWGFGFCGNKKMASGVFEPFETQVVRNLLPQIDIFVNVGANVGYYCCHALSLGKPTIAIEPIPNNLKYLLNNMKFNSWEKHIEVFPVALGSRHDILEIWGNGTAASLIQGWGSNINKFSTKVPVLTLDRVIGKSIETKKALILIDVEGTEYDVLKGALKTLQNTPRPIWVVEITTTEHQPQEVGINPHFVETFKLFFDYGYRGFTVEENSQEIYLHEVEKITANNKILEIHNFIFKAN